MSENMSEMSENMSEMSENMSEMNGTESDAGFTDGLGRHWRNPETMYVLSALELDDRLREEFDGWLVTCSDERLGIDDATAHVATELCIAVIHEYDAAVEQLMDCGFQVVLEACMTHPAFMHVDWDAIARTLLESAGYGQRDEWTRASRDE